MNSFHKEVEKFKTQLKEYELSKIKQKNVTGRENREEGAVKFANELLDIMADKTYNDHFINPILALCAKKVYQLVKNKENTGNEDF